MTVSDAYSLVSRAIDARQPLIPHATVRNQQVLLDCEPCAAWRGDKSAQPNRQAGATSCLRKVIVMGALRATTNKHEKASPIAVCPYGAAAR